MNWFPSLRARKRLVLCPGSRLRLLFLSWWKRFRTLNEHLRASHGCISERNKVRPHNINGIQIGAVVVSQESRVLAYRLGAGREPVWGGRARAAKYTPEQLAEFSKNAGRPAKLDGKARRKLQAMLEAGRSQAECAAELGISTRTIGRAVARMRNGIRRNLRNKAHPRASSWLAPPYRAELRGRGSLRIWILGQVAGEPGALCSRNSRQG